MDYDVRLEQSESRPLAVVRFRSGRAELPRTIPEGIGRVWNFARANGLTGLGRNIALYWDDVFNLEAGVEIDGPFEGDGEVFASALPAGETAAVTLFGPYSQLGEVHRAIHEWCHAHGRSIAGPSWEIYGHWTEEMNTDPSKIRTDVVYLLKLAGA